MLDYCKDRLPDKLMNLSGWMELVEEGKLVKIRAAITVGIKGSALRIEAGVPGVRDTEERRSWLEQAGKGKKAEVWDIDAHCALKFAQGIFEFQGVFP